MHESEWLQLYYWSKQEEAMPTAAAAMRKITLQQSNRTHQQEVTATYVCVALPAP